MAEQDNTSIELVALETPEPLEDDHPGPEATHTADTYLHPSLLLAAQKARVAMGKITLKKASTWLGKIIGITAIFVAI
jgi:hypothetical protein